MMTTPQVWSIHGRCDRPRPDFQVMIAAALFLIRSRHAVDEPIERHYSLTRSYEVQGEWEGYR